MDTQVLVPTQAETQLHSLEWEAAGIGLYVNAHKTEYMWFNQRGDISTLNGSSQKLVDKFTYRGSIVSSTEKDINTQRHGQLSISYQSDLTNNIKRNDHVDTAVWMHYMDAN